MSTDGDYQEGQPGDDGFVDSERALYWIVPVIAATIWTLTLAFLMLDWLARHRPRLPLMAVAQNLPYISDIGAGRYKPLFIIGNILFVFFWLAILNVEQELRIWGTLAPNKTELQITLANIANILALLGGVGLIMLGILDVEIARFLHLGFLGVFVFLSLAALCIIAAKYWLLSLSHPNDHALRTSLHIKLVLVIIGGMMALGFAVANVMNRRSNWSAILEWLVAVFFVLFVLSYAYDFYPIK